MPRRALLAARNKKKCNNLVLAARHSIRWKCQNLDAVPGCWTVSTPTGSYSEPEGPFGLIGPGLSTYR